MSFYPVREIRKKIIISTKLFSFLGYNLVPYFSSLLFIVWFMLRMVVKNLS